MIFSLIECCDQARERTSAEKILNGGWINWHSIHAISCPPDLETTPKAHGVLQTCSEEDISALLHISVLVCTN